MRIGEWSGVETWSDCVGDRSRQPFKSHGNAYSIPASEVSKVSLTSEPVLISSRECVGRVELTFVTSLCLSDCIYTALSRNAPLVFPLTDALRSYLFFHVRGF